MAKITKEQENKSPSVGILCSIPGMCETFNEQIMFHNQCQVSFNNFEKKYHSTMYGVYDIRY